MHTDWSEAAKYVYRVAFFTSMGYYYYDYYFLFFSPEFFVYPCNSHMNGYRRWVLWEWIVGVFVCERAYARIVWHISFDAHHMRTHLQCSVSCDGLSEPGSVSERRFEQTYRRRCCRRRWHLHLFLNYIFILCVCACVSSLFPIRFFALAGSYWTNFQRLLGGKLMIDMLIENSDGMTDLWISVGTRAKAMHCA